MFRSPGMSVSIDYYKLMFGFDFHSIHIINQYIFSNLYIFVLITGILFTGPVQLILTKVKDKKMIIRMDYIVSIILLLLCIIRLSSSGYNPFIYFRF